MKPLILQRPPTRTPRPLHYKTPACKGYNGAAYLFLSCHTALEEQVRQLIQYYTLSEDPETIVRDMLAHTVPGDLLP
jgi:hypothetical protein